MVAIPGSGDDDRLDPTIDPMFEMGALSDDHALRRFAAEVDAEEAVRRLGQEAWHRLRTEEAAHFDGLLLDLAERAEPVSLTLVNDRRIGGRIEALGVDLVAMRLDDGGLSLVDRTTVTAVHLPPGAPDLVGDRPTDGPDDGAVGRSGPRLDLHSALERLLVDRPVVRVWTRSSTVDLVGVLERVGIDLLVVAEPDGAMTHVPLAAVVEVRLAGP